MTETVPTKKRRAPRANHLTRGCAIALCGFMLLLVAAVLFFAGQPAWLFFLGLGLSTYLSASLPQPSRVRATRKAYITVPVRQFDAEGRTPLERALHGDDAEQ